MKENMYIRMDILYSRMSEKHQTNFSIAGCYTIKRRRGSKARDESFIKKEKKSFPIHVITCDIWIQK